MKRFVVQETEETPFVDVNPELHEVNIKGNSYPEDYSEFYYAIFDKMEEMIRANPDQECKINLYLKYINTSSAKAYISMFEILEELVEEGCKLMVTWWYNQGDGDMRSQGMYYYGLAEVPFYVKMIAK